METARKLRARARELLGPLKPTRWRTSPQPGAPGADQVSHPNDHPEINVVAPTPTGTPLAAPSPPHPQEVDNTAPSLQPIQSHVPSQGPSSASIVSETQLSAIFDADATTNSFITRPSTVTEDPTTWDIILSKVDTDYVYAVKKPRPTVYVAIVGRELDLAAPVKEAYKKDVQQRLEHQLRLLHDDIMERRDEPPIRQIRFGHTSTGQLRSRVCQNTPQAKLEMSGPLAVDGSLTLRPAIRIECEEGTIKEIRAAVHGTGFNWVRDTTDFNIRVGKGARGTCAVSQEMEDHRKKSLELDEYDGKFDVEFHLGFLPSESAQAHGAVCRTTLYHNGVRIAVRYTRVGGLLDVGKSSMCITTAHQIFDGLAQEIYGPSPTESEDEDGDDDPDTHDSDASLDHGCKTFPSADFTRITKWTRASLGAGAFYGGLYIKPAKWKRSRIVICEGATVASDFAVLHLGRLHRKRFAGKLRSVFPSASNTDAATTQVLLGGGKVCKAFLCPDKDGVTAYGRRVNTTLLGLNYALPPGSSGAWVVKGGDFLGMVIAGYDDEPLAHMISAEDLIADVRAVNFGKFACRPYDDLLSSHRWSRITRAFPPWVRLRETSLPASTASAPVPSKRESALDASTSVSSPERLGVLFNAAHTTPLEAVNIRGHSRTTPMSAPAEVNDLQLHHLFNYKTPIGSETSYARAILDEDLASIGTEATSAWRVPVDSTFMGIPASSTWAGMGSTYASTIATRTILTSIGTEATSAPTIFTDPTSIVTDSVSALNEPTSIDAEVTSATTVSNRSKTLRVTSPSSTIRKYGEPWVGMCNVGSSHNLPVINDSESHVGLPPSNAALDTHVMEPLPDNPRPAKFRSRLLQILTRHAIEAPGKNKKTATHVCSAAKTSMVHGPHMLDLSKSTGERFGWRLDDERLPFIRELYRNTSALREEKTSSLKRQLLLAESILLRHSKWESLFRLLSYGVDMRYLDLVDPLNVLKRPWTCTCGGKRELFLESQTVWTFLVARLLEDFVQKEDFVKLRSTLKALVAMRGSKTTVTASFTMARDGSHPTYHR